MGYGALLIETGGNQVQAAKLLGITRATLRKRIEKFKIAKRLEDGIFRWPKIEDGVMHLSAAQLSALLEGLDWRRVHAARETVTPARPS